MYTDVIRDGVSVHVEAKEDIESGENLARNVDVAIVFVKANSGEELEIVESSIGDRKDLDLWHGGNELIEAVASVNDNVIVWI